MAVPPFQAMVDSRGSSDRLPLHPKSEAVRPDRGARPPRRHVGAWFRARLLADELAVCDLVRLEYLVGTRNATHYDDLLDGLAALNPIPIEPSDWARALEVQRALAQQTGGGQRAVKIPDLLVAASAERAGLELVHYDSDYDRIASITGQKASWVAAP